MSARRPSSDAQAESPTTTNAGNANRAAAKTHLPMHGRLQIPLPRAEINYGMTIVPVLLAVWPLVAVALTVTV